MVSTKLDTVLVQEDALRKKNEKLERSLASGAGKEDLLSKSTQVDGVQVLATRVEAASIDGLRFTGDSVRKSLASGVAVIGAVVDDKPMFVALVTKDLVDRGLHAGNLLQAATQADGRTWRRAAAKTHRSWTRRWRSCRMLCGRCWRRHRSDMRIVGIDFGERRIGVAAADDRMRIALPVTTITVSGDPVDDLVYIIRDQRADELVVGLPLSLSGAEGPQAQRIREVVAALEGRVDIPIRLQDERLTTRQAERAGPPQKKKSVSRAKAGSPGRDATAAAILLQAYLDAQRPYG
jgi:putative Holliday junction resolvase